MEKPNRLAIAQKAKARDDWEERAKKKAKEAVTKAKNSCDIRDHLRGLLKDNLGAIPEYFKHVAIPYKPAATEEERMQLRYDESYVRRSRTWTRKSLMKTPKQQSKFYSSHPQMM